MTNVWKKLVVITSVIVVASLGLNAAQKIGVVNMEKVFTSFYKTKLEDAKMKKQSEIFQKYLVSLNNSRDELNQEFIKLRDATQNIAYSDTERENNRIQAQNKYRQLQAKEAEIQQYNQDKKKQLFDQFEKVREKLVDEIMLVVNSKAKRLGLTVVLDSTGKTMSNIPTVLYYEKTTDLTDDVIKELNIGQSK